MPIVKTIRADDAEPLKGINGWIHDAELCLDAPAFDAGQATVTLPFAQEPIYPVDGLPVPQFARNTVLAVEYRIPYVGCLLRIRDAVAFDGPWDALTEFGRLSGVRWHPARSAVDIHTNFGPIRVQVVRLNVELEITDDISSFRQRRVGRGIPFEATSN